MRRQRTVVYTKMFAEKKQPRAIADKPNLKDIVTVVGNLENDKVVTNAGRRIGSPLMMSSYMCWARGASTASGTRSATELLEQHIPCPGI